MHILVTGGAGYIGSHTVLELLNQNYQVTVVDNLSNSSKKSLQRIQEITKETVAFHKFDLQNYQKLDALFTSNKFDAVIHFAGLKAVGESVEVPLKYYDNNLTCTLVLLKIMNKHKVKQLVFSSSATVYGDPTVVPIKEDSPLKSTNPYGRTKLMIEQILQDLAATNGDWQITSLRYFNPIGAHHSGKIGEDPNGIPNNLLPYVSQVASGRLKKVHIFGNDYPTPDGTGVRDYIHVVDLAKAHIAALKRAGKKDEYRAINIGTGKGASVFEIISAFKKASGKDIPYVIDKRRPGDIATCFADPTLAKKVLKWQAEFSIEDACRDAWKWQANNPNGYN
ncbi:UDP-glucose 4-epimerase GalE [Candidatus Saccharibacteria bacterium]|jgi:UDP-glucose 4-epimerase|nr:UDP-glucose 4-epimerase GalE [Candidatus Saccharibacteria bacterium]HOR23294.1 UDP-glucose 4-epimerase GalE [Candidatus Saccharibacteria bacterium]HPW47787.1 UDP-glucose 4-epimerase GalE [Candidatus Saccharibacteria bacterium]